MNNHNEYIGQDKHLNDPNNAKTILAHIGENEQLSFALIFKIF